MFYSKSDNNGLMIFIMEIKIPVINIATIPYFQKKSWNRRAMLPQIKDFHLKTEACDVMARESF